LQKARQIAKENIEEKQIQYKEQHDKKAKDHDFSIGQQVCYMQSEFLGKNRKLAPTYIGPASIIEINKSVAKIKMDKNKVKTLKVNKLKHFFLGKDKQEDTDAEINTDAQDTNKLIKFDLTLTLPLTCAWSKLIENSAAISALINSLDAASLGRNMA